MGAGNGSEDSLLMRAVDSIGHGTTLEAAFAALVKVLQGPLELWHASLSVLSPEAGTGTIVASWSMTESAFEPGTEVSTSISEGVRATADALVRGEIVLGSVPGAPDSLVDALMRAQGVASGVAVPVHRDARGVLVLTMGSSSVGPLHAVGAPFYRGLAAGIEERVVELLALRTRST
jgi:hypothetical protein